MKQKTSIKEEKNNLILTFFIPLVTLKTIYGFLKLSKDKENNQLNEMGQALLK